MPITHVVPSRYDECVLELSGTKVQPASVNVAVPGDGVIAATVTGTTDHEGAPQLVCINEQKGAFHICAAKV